MKKKILTLLVLVISITTNAQTIFGKWENRDENTGKVEYLVEIYKQNGKAYARIVEITDPKKRNSLCSKCEGKQKNKPILGMDILTGLSKNGDEWSGGTIFDPKKGKTYKAYIKLANKNKLKVRGYLGMALFGRTVYWYRQQ